MILSNSVLLKYFLTSFIALSALFAFFIAKATCWIHCNFESNNTPSTPIVVFDVISEPSMIIVTGLICNITRECIFFSIYFAQTLNPKEKAEKLKIMLRPNNPFVQKYKNPF